MNIQGTIMEDWATGFCIMNKISVPDGAGGFNTTYTDGATFTAVQRHDQTIQAQIAEREGTASTYTFFVDKDSRFLYHDILKRLKDGQYFRVTDPEGKNTPIISGFDIRAIMCERFELGA